MPSSRILRRYKARARPGENLFVVAMDRGVETAVLGALERHDGGCRGVGAIEHDGASVEAFSTLYLSASASVAKAAPEKGFPAGPLHAVMIETVIGVGGNITPRSIVVLSRRTSSTDKRDRSPGVRAVDDC